MQLKTNKLYTLDCIEKTHDMLILHHNTLSL